MTDLARKITIYAGSDGLVIQPIPQKEGRRSPQAISISYRQANIETIHGTELDRLVPSKRFEAFGIVGLLTISNQSFLASIIKREQVANIHEKPIYVITQVALTPLSSKVKAETSIEKTQDLLLKHAEDDIDIDCSDSETEDNYDARENPSHEADDEVDQNRPTTPSRRRTSSVAEDVMAKKGDYGRFGQNWFSRTGWAEDLRRNMGMTSSDNSNIRADFDKPDAMVNMDEGNNQSVSNNKINVNDTETGVISESMCQKLLRTTEILLGSSKSFYFSYDWDITRGYLESNSPNHDLPSHRPARANFFWNHHLLKPFFTAGQSSYSIPLMQGFIGQRVFKLDIEPHLQVSNLDGAGNLSRKLFEHTLNPLKHVKHDEDAPQDQKLTVPESHELQGSQKEFLLTLISRRSIRRAGLRYLRRGIDENGYTANFVETEQILSDPTWLSSKRISSYIQIRGSIPVFWSQSPYSFKPIPRLQHSEETNLQAHRTHIKNLTSTYGGVQAVSLVEKQGHESVVGMEYERLAKTLNTVDFDKNNQSQLVEFEWWDFHENCRGMKFENVNLLMGLLKKTLESHGYTSILEGRLESRQNGVVRTNCMDCLDRTNVTQSACARKILELQLKKEGIDLASEADHETSWFNNLWADNGDAISKQYASTAALKGDFTRTRKRELTGALKDVSLSISRFYNGIFNDHFSQAVIDYLLGNVTDIIFEDFDQRFLTVDPAISIPRLRQQLIQLCQRQAIADEKEEFVNGWILLTPMLPNTIHHTSMQESVLMLTDAALYSCRVDWDLEKLLSFKRIELQCIRNIKYGTYITSTLTLAQMDEDRNFGLVISYTVNEEDESKIHEVSTSTKREIKSFSDKLLTSSLAQVMPAITGRSAAVTVANSKKIETQVLALKALPSRSSVPDGDDIKMSEIEQVKVICTEINRVVSYGRISEVGLGREDLIEHAEIISLDEARRSTGVLEKLSHNLKKFVWG